MGPSKAVVRYTVQIPEVQYLNLSDHTRVELYIEVDVKMQESSSQEPSQAEAIAHLRIRWNKCDLDLYRSVVSTNLTRISTDVVCTLDADLLAKSLTSFMRKTSETACPKPRKKKSGKGLPIWNDSIARAVHASKEAHLLWKKRGCSADPTCSTVARRKAARKAVKKAVRLALYQQRQEFLTTVMDASELDTKTFYKLVKKQLSRSSAASEILQYGGNVLAGAEKIASGFASHFMVWWQTI